MYIKKNARVTFRSNKRSNFKRNNNFSNGKPRNKGNVTQQYNKFLKLAKEASSSGDRIQSEYYYQFTDHYYRLMLELGINFEENEIQEEKSSDGELSVENNTRREHSNSLDEKKNEDNVAVALSSDNDDDVESSDNDDDVESIESISFISEPIKKKTARTKKASQ